MRGCRAYLSALHYLLKNVHRTPKRVFDCPAAVDTMITSQAPPAEKLTALWKDRPSGKRRLWAS